MRLHAGFRGVGALRRGVQIAVVGVLAMVTSGCLFLPAQTREAAFRPAERPWWCTSDVGGDLSPSDCTTASAQLDGALVVAQAHPHAADATAAGAVGSAYVAGVGAGFVLRAPESSFNAGRPDTLLYDGTGAAAQIVGLEWNVASASAPAGFAGANDVWSGPVGGVWTLRAWIVRPFENEVNPFAATHPCLGATSAVYDVTAACAVATHPRPLKILVVNDDGYGAAGIDAVVQALIALPNVDVTVVAPATNQSGTGDRTTPGGVTGFEAQTQSGYPAFAVNGYPADSVLHALKVLGVNPDLVVSGINEGQNIGPLAGISGTVGAARTAARNGIPAVASSQGLGSPLDYPSGVAAVIGWVDDFRLGRAGPPYETVANINVPTCTTGSIRGERRLPLATAFNGRGINSNCTSAVTTLVDDVDGFVNGFTTLSDVGLG